MSGATIRSLIAGYFWEGKGQVLTPFSSLGLRKTNCLLSETPSLGKSRPDVESDVLSFPHASHVIYYVVHKKQLVVFGVLHKRMVPLNHLAEREVI